MAWAVLTDGVNDNLASSQVWVPSDLDNWNVKVLAKRITGTNNAVLFADSDFDDGIYIHSFGAGVVSAFVGGVQAQATGTSFGTGGSSFTDIELDCVSGSVELIVDGVGFGSIARGGLALTRNAVWFGVRTGTSSWMNAQIQSAILTDYATPSNSRDYNATASSHTAGTPVLVDTIGGNDATGVNMPTDGSAWVDLGGGGITVTVSENGPAFTDAINTNLSVNISFTVAENGPSFSDDANVTVSSSSVLNANIAEVGPSFTDSISATLGVNLSATITELGPSFTDSITISTTKDITMNVSESGPSFTDNIIASIPIKITLNHKNIIRVKRKDNTVRIKRKTNIIRVK